MDMIGHQDKIAHSITLPVEMQKRVGNKLAKFKPSQETAATAGIQDSLTSTMKGFLVFGPVIFGEGI
jgi:hypothetical protein